MKKSIYIMPFLVAAMVVANGCKKDTKDQVDTAYPVIDISASTAFPKQCGEIKRGEKFVFRAHFSDNVALGSSSVDIHHNFDHHTHSTEVESCSLQPVKQPVKPFLFIQSYPIAAGQKTYDIQQVISVPTDVDPGDYHFMIRLTDKEGWQTIKGLSIRIQ